MSEGILFDTWPYSSMVIKIGVEKGKEFWRLPHIIDDDWIKTMQE